MKGGMPESRDALKEGCRKGRIRERMDLGKDVFGKGGDAGNEEFWKGGIRERMDSGKEGMQEGGMQERKDLRLVGYREL